MTDHEVINEKTDKGDVELYIAKLKAEWSDELAQVLNYFHRKIETLEWQTSQQNIANANHSSSQAEENLPAIIPTIQDSKVDVEYVQSDFQNGTLEYTINFINNEHNKLEERAIARDVLLQKQSSTEGKIVPSLISGYLSYIWSGNVIIDFAYKFSNKKREYSLDRERSELILKKIGTEDTCRLLVYSPNEVLKQLVFIDKVIYNTREYRYKWVVNPFSSSAGRTQLTSMLTSNYIVFKIQDKELWRILRRKRIKFKYPKTQRWEASIYFIGAHNQKVIADYLNNIWKVVEPKQLNGGQNDIDHDLV